MKRYYLFLFLLILVIPSVTFASWWNPFSWFKKQEVQSSIVQVSVPVINVEDKEIVKEKIIPKKEKQENSQSIPKQIIPVIQKTTNDDNLTIDNSTSNQVSPKNEGCESGGKWDLKTGMPCNGATTKRKKELTPEQKITQELIEKEMEEAQNVLSNTQKTKTLTPTYTELHCPQITIIKDNLGNIGRSPFQGFGIRGEFSKETTKSIILDITATDPQGLPIYFRISSDWPNDSTHDWSLENTYTFDVSGSSKGTHIIAIEIDNGDDFNCLSGRERGDALRQLEYSVY